MGKIIVQIWNFTFETKFETFQWMKLSFKFRISQCMIFLHIEYENVFAKALVSTSLTTKPSTTLKNTTNQDLSVKQTEQLAAR